MPLIVEHRLERLVKIIKETIRKGFTKAMSVFIYINTGT